MNEERLQCQKLGAIEEQADDYGLALALVGCWKEETEENEEEGATEDDDLLN